jgi:UDP-glucuronate decarboxylase
MIASPQTRDQFGVDRDRMFERLKPDWPALKDARILITGGTGFIGRWMLEALRDADQRLGLGVKVVNLSRNPQAFVAKAPHLTSYPAFEFLAGDICDPPSFATRFTHVIHAATDASADLNLNNPRRMFDTVVTGTRRALDIAIETQAQRFFFLSSGAVYGRQPWEIERVPENWMGGPDCQDPRSAYGEGKRAAEMMCAIYGKQFGLDVITARIFALLGPLLSLDIHFAVGNFIRDALDGKTVRVEGSGQAVRSYIYAADLTVWLWTMLLRSQRGSIFNVGSEEAVSLADLAQRVAALIGNGQCEILGKPDPGWNPGPYVPSTAKIRRELGVVAEVGLDDALRCTAIWNGWVQK